MNKHDVEKDLTILDFLATDLHLYLNTHPNDMAALAEYNKVVALAAKAREKYEEHFGPLYSFRSSADKHKWNWLSEFSPWEKEANWIVEKGDKH